MKIRNLLLIGAIALGMVACNNEEVPEIENGAEATISVKVFPSSKSPSMRAVGDLSGDGVIAKGLPEESAIKKLEVWIFAGEAIDGYGFANAAEVIDVKGHAGDRTIVVAANAEIGKVNTKTELLEKLGNLPPVDITTSGLVMTADPFIVTLKAGNNYYGYTDAEVEAKTGTDKIHLDDGKAPLAITRVNARVAIVSAILDKTAIPVEQTPIFDELKEVEVAMFNIPKQTKLFDTQLATNADYVFGAKWPSSANSYVGANDPASTATAGLMNAFEKDNELSIDATNAPYFYVNEENSGINQMFIALRAKVYKNDKVVKMEGLYTDKDGYTYYPVDINLDGVTPNATIGDGNVYRNTQYNINLTIKGIGRPTLDPSEDAFLDVKVQVAPWEVVTQDVEW